MFVSTKQKHLAVLPKEAAAPRCEQCLQCLQHCSPFAGFFRGRRILCGRFPDGALPDGVDQVKDPDPLLLVLLPVQPVTEKKV